MDALKGVHELTKGVNFVRKVGSISRDDIRPYENDHQQFQLFSAVLALEDVAKEVVQSLTPVVCESLDQGALLDLHSRLNSVKESVKEVDAIMKEEGCV
jgi:hypothetical protein